MNDPSRRYRSPRARVPNSLGAYLYLWWRAWRAARAAEEAYMATRAKGAPRDIAAEMAFKALTDVKSCSESTGLPANARPPYGQAHACDHRGPGTIAPAAHGGAA
ncbi:MAG: hypothetical protein ACK4TL_13195 [Hyphomicrobiaceae bacterium]